MLPHYLLAGVTFILLFVMFLVVARTLNSIINLLIKLEYLIQKEYDLKKELLDVRRLIDEEAREKAAEMPGPKTDSGEPGTGK
jgi:low affinity Fe/Cu permease